VVKCDFSVEIENRLVIQKKNSKWKSEVWPTVEIFGKKLILLVKYRIFYQKLKLGENGPIPNTEPLKVSLKVTRN